MVQDYLQNNERIWMRFLPEMCLGSRNNTLKFGDDPDHGPESGSRGGDWPSSYCISQGKNIVCVLHVSRSRDYLTIMTIDFKLRNTFRLQ